MRSGIFVFRTVFELIKNLRKQNTKNIWFIFGPSGAGKTSLGEYLTSQHNWLHLDIDQLHGPKGDGIDKLKLRREWDQFYFNFEVGPLVSAIRKKICCIGIRALLCPFPVTIYSVPTISARSTKMSKLSTCMVTGRFV